MSRAYKCDRCGKFYDKPDEKDRATIKNDPIDMIELHSHYDPIKVLDKFDLCPDCANSLADWISFPMSKVTLIDDSRR